MGEFIYETEEKFKNKNILIVSHEYPIWMLYSAVNGFNEKESIEAKGNKDNFIENGQFIILDFVPLPHNRDHTLDLHRPYIDEVDVVCDECGGEMKKNSGSFGRLV